MTIQKLIVPGTPVAKGRPRFGRGHVYTPKATKDHEELIRQFALVAGIRPVDGPVKLSCRFYTSKAMDGDNAIKLVADSLAPPRGAPAGRGNAYHNDKQIKKWEAEVIYSKTQHRTVIEIEAL